MGKKDEMTLLIQLWGQTNVSSQMSWSLQYNQGRPNAEVHKKETIHFPLQTEKNLPEIKNYKKIKYSIAIISSTLIIAAVITLSIGHFKVEVIEEGT